jgi:hypothetical protein
MKDQDFETKQKNFGIALDHLAVARLHRPHRALPRPLTANVPTCRAIPQVSGPQDV